MTPKKIITARPDTLKEYLFKIWENKALILTFAKRDIKVKYAQTLLGLSWSVLQPATAIIVYSLFFHFVVKIDTGEVHYVLFVISGLTCWTLFSYIFSQGSFVLMGSQEIIKKMAFPKIILVFSKVLVGLTEFLVSFVLLVLVWLFLGSPLSWKVLFLPIPIIGIILIALAITLMLLAFSIKRRDLLHIGPFMVYFGIWFTPVFYPVSLVPEQFKEFIYLNPIAAMIDMFRWSIGVNNDFSHFFIIGFFVTLIWFLLSLVLFKNKEDQIVDNL